MNNSRPADPVLMDFWDQRKPPRGVVLGNDPHGKKKKKSKYLKKFASQPFFKAAGILDPVQKEMASDVWDEDLLLKKGIRQQIFDMIRNLIPNKDNIKGVYILGSITGYQWTPTSDIDVNVLVDPPELLTPELNEKRHGANGELAEGSDHPINIFLQPWIGKAPSWQDLKYGVYDVSNDTWANPPQELKDILDPEKRFTLELLLSKFYNRNFVRLLKKHRQGIQELKELKKLPNFPEKEFLVARKEREVEQDYEDLETFVKDAAKERKFEYRYGWGTPRENWRNIIFKSLEHSKNHDIFEKLKEKKDEDE